MLTNSRYLVLAFQLWAICVRAQVNQIQQEPPYILLRSVIGNSEIDNNILFTCTTVSSFSLTEWVLYRNGVSENTTDSCTSPGNYSSGVLTISSECDGLYSCGAKYTNGLNEAGLVLSAPLAVYGKCLGLPFSDCIMEKG